jgi:hypothetical protein
MKIPKALLILCFVAPVFYLQAQVPDYSKYENWAAHGAKKDPSDDVPRKLRNNIPKKILANVFFIHPTTYTDKNESSKSWFADVHDSALNEYTDKTTIRFQASCFNEQCLVYAPRYRQAHIECFFTNEPGAKSAFDTAYADVRAAFLYFLQNENKDMPIIIAAHSQGTVHAARLIKEFFEYKSLQNKLVAAYLIGMPAYKNYFSAFRPCSSPESNNCFVSWRTYLKGSGDQFTSKEISNSIYVTNPLNWSMDSVSVPRIFNKGAVLLKFNKLYKRVNGAVVHNNVLWISKPKFPFSFLVTNKRTNYHIADINLFYINIRENVKTRLNNYMNTHKVQE